MKILGIAAFIYGMIGYYVILDYLVDKIAYEHEKKFVVMAVLASIAEAAFFAWLLMERFK